MQDRVEHREGIGSVASRQAVACLATLAIVLLVAASVASAAPRDAAYGASGAQRSQSVAKAGDRARAKARTRAALRRELRRDPKAVLTRSFLRRAGQVNFKLPLTVRLRPGAALGVSFLALRHPLDSTTYPLPAAPQSLPLSGQFAMEMEFGTSAGGFGSLPSRSGQYVSFSSTSGLRVAEFGDCPDPPPDPRPAFLESTPGRSITMSSGALTWTLLNPFSASADGDLFLELQMRSRVRRLAATCAGPGDVADFDLPASPSGTEPWVQPVRVAWSGFFRIAPSIDARGRMRLGKIVANEPAQPQPTTTGNIWACAPSSVLIGPTVPPANACNEAGTPLDPAMEAVGAAPFPAQLKVTSFDADVLIGDVPPP